MIEKLEQLTVDKFIDLVCGDTSVLLTKGMPATPAQLAFALRNIVFEYTTIADPTGAKSYLATAESLIKARITHVIFSICDNLISLGDCAHVREILDEYGINAGKMDELRLTAEVKSRLGRARNEIEQAKFESETKNGGKTIEIRRMFDEQTVAIMAHYKFQIDTSTMKASTYAHLISRQSREIKAQLAALKNK